MKPVKIAMMGMTHGHTRKYYQTLLENQKLDWVASCAADARAAFDWEKQWECAIDPETAKAIREDRKPESDDTCSMCGKFCAVRSMNKALNGEYIDIL